METKRHLRTLGSALLTLTATVTLAARASATLLTIDQQNTANTANETLVIGTGAGYGQSFTPLLPAVNAATFNLGYTTSLIASIVSQGGSGGGAEGSGGVPASALDSVTVRADLFAGAGFSGMLMASSGTATISSTTAASTEFDFAAPVALVIGNLYTLRVTFVSATASNGTYFVTDSGNVYTRGTEFDPSGSATTGSDLTFAEGSTTVIPAPEPSVWALLGPGVAGALGLKLRRRRTACPA